MIKFLFNLFSGRVPAIGAVVSIVYLFLGIESANAQWKVIGTGTDIAATTSTYNAIASYKNTIYVAFTDGSNSPAKVRVKKYSGSAWSDLGFASDGNSSYINIAVDTNNIPYVIFRDVSSSGKATVKRYVNNAWELVGTRAFSSGGITYNSIIIDNNNVPYIAYADATLGAVVQKYVETTAGSGTYSWQTVGPVTGFSGGAIDLPSLALDRTNNNLFIIYSETNNSKKASVKRYNADTNDWTTLGSSLSSGEARTPDIIAKNNTIYIAYTDIGASTPRVTVKYYNLTDSIPAWATFGTGTVSTRNGTYVNLDIDRFNAVYAAFIDQRTNTNGTYDMRVRYCADANDTWQDVANDTSALPTTSATYSAMTLASDNRPYIVYGSSANVPTAQVYGEPLETTTTTTTTPDAVVTTPKQMEYLTRGVVATRISTSQVLVSWRLLGTDAASVSFNVYRNGTKVNASPITNSTNYVDNTTVNSTYTIKQVLNGTESNETSSVSVWTSNILQIPIQQPAGGTTPDAVAYTYSANDASVGDVDGDGEYEIFLKWDPSNSKDNSQSGYTGNVFIDCYKLNGTRLWRIDLGKNIRAGAHYTQFMVYDFDGDGKAEMACKTADGTTDGTGVIIGSASVDYRNSNGYILSGPEYLTMFNGQTGRAMSTVNFLPARGTVSSWGDSYGNRVDRFIAAVAYLDGAKPSLIMGRGYYTRLVRVAWDFTGGTLKQRWIFDSNSSGNAAYAGQGNHQMSVADVDADGKQEILNGSSTINDNGVGLWTDSKGHGDALHVTDMDPTTPELEEWMNHEEQGSYSPYGLRMKNAKTGETLWGVTSTGDIGRSMAADIDPNYPGYEVWGSTGGNIYTNKGVAISTNVPSYNFGIWWDGDLSREILDGTKMDKWNWTTKTVGRLYTIYNAAPISSNNSTKSNPCLTADILGDWREEMLFRASDNQSLYLFVTPYVTDKRIYTLMHDPQYRVAIAWQNSAYNQPPYPSFFLGNDMTTPSNPNIYLVGGTALPIKLVDFKAKANGNKVLISWTTASEQNNKSFTVERSHDGISFTDVVTLAGAGNSSKLLNYSAVDYSPLTGTSYYRLRQTDTDGNSSESGTQAVTLLTKETGLSISPNPAESQITLSLNTQNTALGLALYSIDGKLLLSAKGSLQELNSRLNSILPSLTSGVYVVQVADTTEVYTQKLIKK